MDADFRLHYALYRLLRHSVRLMIDDQTDYGTVTILAVRRGKRRTAWRFRTYDTWRRNPERKARELQRMVIAWAKRKRS